MPQREVLRDLAAFARQIDSAAPLHANVPIPGHALQCGSHCWWCDIQLFGQARADGCLIFLKHFPNGFEVIFLRHAGLLASQSFSPPLISAPIARDPFLSLSASASTRLSISSQIL